MKTSLFNIRNVLQDHQLLFVKFPIIFPLIYGFVLYFFPGFEDALIILTILLLAETHFGATWPFFIDKTNNEYIKKKKFELVSIPFFIILFSIIGFFLFKKTFLLIFFAANVYHVTRQSFGVSKLYVKIESEIKFQEFAIYSINLLFFLVALLRFYVPIISEENLLDLNILIILSLFILFTLYVYKFGLSQNFLIFITGCIIFYPVCFVSNPVHSILMGVTMHYTQYLYLTHHVYKERELERDFNFNNFFNNKYFYIIIIYSIFMTLMSLFGKFEQSILKQLILIPIIAQMIHFYLDSQLWKFSEKHNRDNILKFINKLTNF